MSELSTKQRLLLRDIAEATAGEEEDLDRVLGYRECPFRKSKDAQRPTEIREGK